MLLAVDTSTPQIGLALYDGAQVLAESLWVSQARHTVELAPAVAELLKHTGFKIDQIQALGVAIGPGSFTALRVGLSFVKGLAFALSLPVIGINTLDVVAASQPASPQPLVCILPAGRGRLAVCWYTPTQSTSHQAASRRSTVALPSAWQSQGGPSIMTAEALSVAITQDSVVCGDLSEAERLALKTNEHIWLVSPALSARRPAILAELAYNRWRASSQLGDVEDVSSLAPLYLHLSEPIPGGTAGAFPADSFVATRPA
jgi:tRNA threonylcarbamoyladenosine biosynthesis protein TsaB